MPVVIGNDVVMENLIVVAKIVAMTGLQDFTVYGEECKFGGTYWKEGGGVGQEKPGLRFCFQGFGVSHFGLVASFLQEHAKVTELPGSC